MKTPLGESSAYSKIPQLGYFSFEDVFIFPLFRMKSVIKSNPRNLLLIDFHPKIVLTKNRFPIGRNEVTWLQEAANQIASVILRYATWSMLYTNHFRVNVKNGPFPASFCLIFVLFKQLYRIKTLDFSGILFENLKMKTTQLTLFNYNWTFLEIFFLK